MRKVAPKYEAFLCFFYMNIVACHKEYWKMIRNIQFYNSCFKFGCGNRVDENMIYSCCVFLVTRVGLFMNGIMLWPNIILRKFCTFLFCSKSRMFILKSPSIIASFFRMSFVDSILFKCFSNSFTSPFGGLYVRFRIMFFDFSFVISRHNDSMASQFIDKFV